MTTQKSYSFTFTLAEVAIYVTYFLSLFFFCTMGLDILIGLAVVALGGGLIAEGFGLVLYCFGFVFSLIGSADFAGWLTKQTIKFSNRIRDFFA